MRTFDPVCQDHTIASEASELRVLKRCTLLLGEAERTLKHCDEHTTVCYGEGDRVLFMGPIRIGPIKLTQSPSNGLG